MNEIKFAPTFQSIDEIKLWLFGLDFPSAYFDDVRVAHTYMKQASRDLVASGKEIRESKDALGLSNSEFAEIIGVGGNTQTKRTQVQKYISESLTMPQPMVAKMRIAVIKASLDEQGE